MHGECCGGIGLRAHAGYLANDLARDHLAHDRRHKGCGAKFAALAARRALARLKVHGLFARVEYFKVTDSAFAALFAHDARERVVNRFMDVGDAQAFWMQLVGAPHGTNERQASLLGEFGDGELGRDGIDGVHNVIVPATLREEAVPMASTM